jgi:putative colanic acid biosynthesis acetyltransferase WcaF
VVWPLFRLSPRPMFGWRRFLLRALGATIGKEVHVHANVAITMPWNLSIGDWSAIGDGAHLYALGPITIGREVTISQRANLCAGTHDYTRRDMPLLKTPIVIDDQVWVCAEAFIGPGVTVGQGAVVGARAVAIQNVGSWEVVAGNPARVVKRRKLRDS